MIREDIMVLSSSGCNSRVSWPDTMYRSHNCGCECLDGEVMNGCYNLLCNSWTPCTFVKNFVRIIEQIKVGCSEARTVDEAFYAFMFLSVNKDLIRCYNLKVLRNRICRRLMRRESGYDGIRRLIASVRRHESVEDNVFLLMQVDKKLLTTEHRSGRYAPEES